MHWECEKSADVGTNVPDNFLNTFGYGKHRNMDSSSRVTES